MYSRYPKLLESTTNLLCVCAHLKNKDISDKDEVSLMFHIAKNKNASMHFRKVAPL